MGRQTSHGEQSLGSEKEERKWDKWRDEGKKQKKEDEEERGEKEAAMAGAGVVVQGRKKTKKHE